jgi:hypothetical protein
MGRKKIDINNASKPKTIGISIRIDVEKNRKFSAILALKGMTATGFFQKSIDKFIIDNYQEARDLLNIGDLAGNDDKDSKPPA